MISALASEPHYRAHLEPVVQALGARWASEPSANGTWLVAGYRDMRRLAHQPMVMFEHGAGQSYGTVHGAYAGGTGRGDAILFICPNEQSAQRNRARYPDTPAVVVGSPRLEQLRTLPFDAEGTVAITWHWNADAVAPEAHWAYPHFRSVLKTLSERYQMIGHAHPRIAGFMRQQYEEAGIEYVADFEEVCRRASVLVADNTSVMFEFAALGRPVVVMNAPWYRRDVDLGGRFWDWADVGIQVDEPEELVDAISEAVADRDDVRRRRAEIVQEIYPFADATRRATEAIKEVTKMSDVEQTPEETPQEETPEEGTNTEVEVPAETPVETTVE